VHPALLRAYLMGRVVATPPALRRSHRRRPGAALRRDEVLVLQFLQEEM
jgi:hypothetical protein